MWMMAMLGDQRSKLQELAVSAIAAQVAAASAEGVCGAIRDSAGMRSMMPGMGLAMLTSLVAGDNMDEDEW